VVRARVCFLVLAACHAAPPPQEPAPAPFTLKALGVGDRHCQQAAPPLLVEVQTDALRRWTEASEPARPALVAALDARRIVENRAKDLERVNCIQRWDSTTEQFEVIYTRHLAAVSERVIDEGRCTKYDHLRPSPMPCPPPRRITATVVDAGVSDGLTLSFDAQGTFVSETWHPPSPLAAGTTL
jgi:hypothetical protein